MRKNKNNINKDNILRQLKDKLLNEHNFDIPLTALNTIITEFFSLIVDNVKNGYEVQWQKFGKWYARHMADTMRKAPNQDEEVYVPAYKSIRFSAAKTIRDIVRFNKSTDS